MTLTATYDGTLARVRLTATSLGPAAVKATIERSTDLARWTPVRGALDQVPTGEQLVASDYEFASDVVNYYRVKATDAAGLNIGPAITPNPFFETDAAGWSVTNGTFVRSTAQKHEGVASGLLTPNGVSATVTTRSDLGPALPGGLYRATAWLRCAVARNVDVAVDWHQAGGAFISSSVQTVALAANTWTPVTFTATGPALTGQARITAAMGSTPAAGHLLYVDEARLSHLDDPAAAPGMYETSFTPSLAGLVWLKSIARPFLNRAVTVVDVGDEVRADRSGEFDVVGRSLPVAVTDVRGAPRWPMRILAGSPADAEDLDLLFASGDLLYVHVPGTGPGQYIRGGYVKISGDVVQSRPTQTSPRRLFAFVCQQVAAPGPDVVGALSTWQTVINAYATWADLIAAKATWQDVLDLVGSPSDVIVP